MSKKSHKNSAQIFVDLATTQRSIGVCEMYQKNEEEELHLDANVVDDIVEESHVQNEEEEESDNNKSFEVDDNNIDDKHKANEGGSNLQNVSTHLALILFEAI